MFCGVPEQLKMTTYSFLKHPPCKKFIGLEEWESYVDFIFFDLKLDLLIKLICKLRKLDYANTFPALNFTFIKVQHAVDKLGKYASLVSHVLYEYL